MTLKNRRSSEFPEKFDFYRPLFSYFLFWGNTQTQWREIFIYFDLTKNSFKSKVPAGDLHVRTNILKSMIAWLCVSFQYIAHSPLYEDSRENFLSGLRNSWKQLSN